ncbi:serine/threonine-protein kinase [Salinibacterium sp. GXW1014]|uniref:serine/threonine-protein kinase n=1 Tax=Salinibacterium sp. GXW1014 TaxID=3377838 RepID=UPI00383B209E
MTTLRADEHLLGGRYRLSQELGRGGMSTVHRATDEALGREVAVKVLANGLTDAEGLARHREEVQLLASLSHPGLVTLFDAATDEEADCAFLVMELIDGQDLRTRLMEGPLPPTEVAVIGRHLAEALTYTHSRAVVHRDVKPGNILLPRRDGEVTGAPAKLADFGIARIVDGARLTATGTVLGSAGYFSPEQALGAPLTGASDFYSLGLVLLEALTGERAFPGSAAESMAARIHRDPHMPAGLDAEWTEVLSLMTARDPEQRLSGLDAAERLSQLASRPLAEATQPLHPAASVDPTLPFPVAETTTQDVGDATKPEHAGDSTKPEHAGEKPEARDATRPSQRRRMLLWVAIVAALIIVVTVVAVALQSRTADPISPSYPAVEGELGESLEQLQRSVEP